MSLKSKLRNLQEEICREYSLDWRILGSEFIAAVDHYPTFRVIVVRGILDIRVGPDSDQVNSTLLELNPSRGEGVYRAKGITLLYY